MTHPLEEERTKELGASYGGLGDSMARSYDLALRDLGRISVALGHKDVARPDSPANLVNQWIEEIYALRLVAARTDFELPYAMLQRDMLVTMLTRATGRLVTEEDIEAWTHSLDVSLEMSNQRSQLRETYPPRKHLAEPGDRIRPMEPGSDIRIKREVAKAQERLGNYAKDNDYLGRLLWMLDYMICCYAGVEPQERVDARLIGDLLMLQTMVRVLGDAEYRRFTASDYDWGMTVMLHGDGYSI